MAQKLYEENNIKAIADAIRGKNGLTDKYKPSEMAAAISAITTGGGGGGDLPEEAFLITGKCDYRFAYGGWDWFIREYGDRVVTDKLSGCSYMFNISDAEYIPFTLNFSTSSSYHACQYMFAECENLKSIPKFVECKPSSLERIFYLCRNLRNLPEDFEDYFNFSYLDNLTSGYSGSQSYMFRSCYSLRSIPIGFLNHGNPVAASTYAYFSNGFRECAALDELVNLPIPYTNTWTTNAFTDCMRDCNRLKNFTFAMPNGQPYVMNWKTQTLDFSIDVGYTGGTNNSVLNYNSGITADKEVIDDATYQALKNDPDWFTCKLAYSRYNHDSAVSTINSLPDTSAYLATAGGTNTIKFKGASGSATDGGAINTLTEAEIAVATAKGWTITLS